MNFLQEREWGLMILDGQLNSCWLCLTVIFITSSPSPSFHPPSLNHLPPQRFRQYQQTSSEGLSQVIIHSQVDSSLPPLLSLSPPSPLSLTVVSFLLRPPHYFLRLSLPLLLPPSSSPPPSLLSSLLSSPLPLQLCRHTASWV